MSDEPKIPKRRMHASGRPLTKDELRQVRLIDTTFWLCFLALVFLLVRIFGTIVWGWQIGGSR